ncbi:MAG TPA: aromatic ring-hydroxylating dioxygenase subunit alpha [Sphingomonadales bacterium]|jgi:phenylpropionate dioxygenase-like ring-hydroxylating dioxygenase large terminal subunit
MLINNWYVAAYSKDVVEGKPFGVRMLGCDFVLFRDSDGKVACLSDVCVHRGASLSRGKVHCNGASVVACPFHGWEFDASGRCTRIPSMGDVKVPKRARVDSYPVVEKYDWIWVFLGDLPEDKRPPIPDLLPEYDDPNWRSTHLLTEVPVNWTKIEENSIDTAHLSFVHAVFGSREDPKATIVPLEKRPYGYRVYRERTAPKASQKTGILGELLSEERTKTSVTLEFSVVGISHRINPEFRPGMQHVVFSATTPVDLYNSRVFSIQARNYATDPKYDQERIDGRKYAIKEDISVVQHVRPRVGPTPVTDEFLVEADSMEAAFRRCVNQLIDKGWEIDSRKVAEEYDRKVYVIPSPERRADPKNWVHDAVPTTRPRQEDDAFEIR